MVSLKTPDSPAERNRLDFKTIEEYVEYLELKVEYQTMKDRTEKIRRQLKKGDPPTKTVETFAETPAEEIEEGEQGEVADATEVEEDESYTFLKGHQDSKNPGKLIVGIQRFTSARTKETENGFRYFYQCALKAESKGKKGGELCKASLAVDTNEEGGEVSLSKIPRESDHNHRCEKSQAIRWQIMAEITECFSSNETVLPSIVRKKTILKYKVKYRSEPELWQEILLLLPSDENIDKRLREIRLKHQGKLPKSKEEIDVATILENLKNWGGENVLVLDSDQMWLEEEFRDIFKDEEGFDSTPARVILFSSPLLLTQLANSSKWSQVNNYAMQKLT